MTSGVSRQIPLAAYDHVAKLLKEAAGQDGVVSRQDAAELVAKLKAEGKGTEALAAETLFEQIDKADAGRGARVTGYDLDRHRETVAAMLEGADLNLDGVLRGPELKLVEQTGAALLELGQTLAASGRPGRVPHRIPLLGMQHVAALLTLAGRDGVVSRDDAQQLSQDLRAQGRGTEALAVDFWFAFIDHRDHRPGARVTAADIQRALEYSDEHLLKAKDKNHNGYSAREIGRFSTSAKAFLLLGQMIDAGILEAARLDSNRFTVGVPETLTSRNAPELSERFFALCATLGLDEHVYTRATLQQQAGGHIDEASGGRLHEGLYHGDSPDHPYRAMSERELLGFLDDKFGGGRDVDLRADRFGELLAALRAEAGSDQVQVFVSAGPEAGAEEGADVLFVFPEADRVYGLSLLV